MRSFLCVITKILLAGYLAAPVMAADVKLMRKNNLDYLDIATMDHFLSSDVRNDYNVAVLFYAQWCRNCHAFAPLWDKMSRILQAGTKDSRLIMGLFDCEASVEASKLCSKAGITKYPGIFFISTSGQRFTRGETSHLTRFPGNWQYGDAVIDWIRTLQGLDSWHRSGWGKRLRNFLSTKKSKPEMLPVGIPGAIQSEAVGKTTEAAAVDTSELLKLKEEASSLGNLVVRSSSMLDALLFPIAKKNATGDQIIQDPVSGKKASDMFSLIHTRWDSTDLDDVILKTCVSEITIDYCQRLASHLTEKWMNAYLSIEDITSADIDKFSMELPDKVIENEPYCGIIEDCVKKDFADDACRPKACPFTDPTACRYVTACLSDAVNGEYRTALSKEGDDQGASGKEQEETPGSASKEEKRGWGM